MGGLRLVFIFIGIAVCSELPLDDGISLFRSYFSFFIMFTLDYARMWFKGVSWYEKLLGIVGSIYTFIHLAFNWLALSGQFVLHKTEATYYISSSSTFRMIPDFKVFLDPYIQWTAIMTLSLAVCELLVPAFNRYSQRKKVDSTSNEVKEKVSWYRFWNRNAIGVKEIKNKKVNALGEGGKLNEYN